MSNVLVSIVCTNFNKGDWIADALESFLLQEVDFSYEILVIDDASTDNSPEIIKRYADAHPTIIRPFFNEKNLGITRTWIRICKEAKGTYIARCDGDDYWTDTKKLQKQLALLNKNKRSQWSSTDYDIISPSGAVKHTSAFKSGLVDRSESYAQMLTTKGFTMSSTWLVDTKLMQAINAEIDPDAVDDTFNIQLELFNRTELAFLPESTVVYRVNEGSDSRPIELDAIKKRSERLLRTQIQYIDKYEGVAYNEMLKMLLQRNMEQELLAIERLQSIYDQRVHIKRQEEVIYNLEHTLHHIIDSKSYKTALKLRNTVLPAKIFTKKVINKLLWLDGRRRYKKYYTSRYVDGYRNDFIENEFEYNPLISVIVPVFETNLRHLREMIDSVVGQHYANWELILVDDHSPSETVRRAMRKAARNDERIKCIFLKKNHHIAGATNEGFKVAGGEYVSLLDHDDILHPAALHEIVSVLNAAPKHSVGLLYTDEDKINEQGLHYDPFLKPDWNQELLYSINYITHFTTIRKSLVVKIGGERTEYNGAQDWDLYLRATQHLAEHEIKHIPKILYSWRVHNASTAKNMDSKPYVRESQEKLLRDNLRARGLRDDQFSIEKSTYMDGAWKVSYEGQDTDTLHKEGEPVEYEKISGLAMSKNDIIKHLGYRPIIGRYYKDCRYEITK